MAGTLDSTCGFLSKHICSVRVNPLNWELLGSNRRSSCHNLCGTDFNFEDFQFGDVYLSSSPGSQRTFSRDAPHVTDAWRALGSQLDPSSNAPRSKILPQGKPSLSTFIHWMAHAQRVKRQTWKCEANNNGQQWPAILQSWQNKKNILGNVLHLHA